MGGQRMARTQFESLQIYRLAESLSDAVWTIAREWPEFDRRTVGLQLVRAADSVGANIAEGSGRGTFADDRRFVRMARGSLYECKHWLRRAWNRQLLKADEVDQLKTIVDELGPKLNAYLNSIGKTGSRAVPQGRRSSNPQEDGQSPSSNH